MNSREVEIRGGQAQQADLSPLIHDSPAEKRVDFEPVYAPTGQELDDKSHSFCTSPGGMLLKASKNRSKLTF